MRSSRWRWHLDGHCQSNLPESSFPRPSVMGGHNNLFCKEKCLPERRSAEQPSHLRCTASILSDNALGFPENASRGDRVPFWDEELVFPRQRWRAEYGMEENMSELTDLYVRLLKAWNDRDAKAMAACFGDEAVMIGFDGSMAEGQGAIETHLAPIFRDHPTAAYTAILRSEHTYGDVRLLRADAGMLPYGKQDLQSETISRQTLVARQTDSGLRIVLFQNTAIALDQDKATRATIYGDLQQALKGGDILQL
jgi:uncharacterized protein (TIGR02246 family)